ncbi:MAG: hypothetical protein P8Y71_29595 [Pseudolabrys sp.]|jgi:hypothetical protein
MAKLYMHIYAWAALTVTVAGLAAMLIWPPHSTNVDRNGVPYFTPQVIDPVTGKAVDLSVLVRHYRGD